MFGRRTYSPVLQIVHITDLHVVVPAARTFASRFRVVLRFFPAAAKRFIEERSAPHDETALEQFHKFLPTLLSEGGEWNRIPVWVLDTGDLTGYGDLPSLQHGQQWLRRWSITNDSSTGRALYGNHDAWPENIPILARNDAINAQLATLRSNGYQYALPMNPLRVSIPGSRENAFIELWCLNSVDRGRVPNTLAYGTLRNDDPPGPAGTGIDEMWKRICASGENKRQAFRIVATHHPIHYPPPEPKLSMVMTNASFAGQQLASLDSTGRPVAHLILSGHTHALFPKPDELPSRATKCNHTPLAPPVCQLVGPTLSQQDFNHFRWPHQFQLLRFYFAPEAQDELLMERVVAGREWGIGPFQVIEHPESGTGEEIRFRF